MQSMPSTGSLCIHKECPTWDSVRKHQHTQLTLILTQISQTDKDSNQISPIDVSPGTIIYSLRRSSPLQCWNQPQPMQYPPKYLQHLCCQTPRLLLTFPTDSAATWIISNRRHNSLKYFQLMPGLLNPPSWLLRGCLKVWLPDFFWYAWRKLFSLVS